MMVVQHLCSKQISILYDPVIYVIVTISKSLAMRNDRESSQAVHPWMGLSSRVRTHDIVLLSPMAVVQSQSSHHPTITLSNVGTVQTRRQYSPRSLWREDRSRPARCRHGIGHAFIDSIVLHSIHAVLKAEREWKESGKRDCHGTGERNAVLETSQLHRFEFPLHHHPAEVITARSAGDLAIETGAQDGIESGTDGAAECRVAQHYTLLTPKSD
jgi:hypothetical protein